MFRRLAFLSADADAGCAPSDRRGSALGIARPGELSRGRAVGAVEELTPRLRRSVVAAMLLLHAGAAAWLLLMPARAPLPAVLPATLRVDWIAAPSPAAEPSRPADPATSPPRLQPPRALALPPQPLLAAPEAALPAALVTMLPPRVDSAPTPLVETAPTPALASLTAPAVVPPAAKTLPPEAVQYLLPPAPIYPKLSRRHGESGRVLVRAYIDEGGVPRSVQVTESSGHPRLDEAARSAVEAARFKPYAENGRPTAGWAFVPLTFDLEK